MSVIGPIQTCHFRHEASITSDVNDVRVVVRQAVAASHQLMHSRRLHVTTSFSTGRSNRLDYGTLSRSPAEHAK